MSNKVHGDAEYAAIVNSPPPPRAPREPMSGGKLVVCIVVAIILAVWVLNIIAGFVAA